jgi:hypothetical protein
MYPMYENEQEATVPLPGCGVPNTVMGVVPLIATVPDEAADGELVVSAEMRFAVKIRTPAVIGMMVFKTRVFMIFKSFIFVSGFFPPPNNPNEIRGGGNDLSINLYYLLS